MMKGKTMITSEKIRNQMQDTSEEFGGFLEKVFEYVLQQEKLTKAVKRYFELKAKGITSIEETNEHRELLNKINEMVGIKE